ncbi:hypothetical protein AVEN_46436-1 [Araneus ventricosus]|uniref:Uncharacterized protein n=1 Tax=Araneus ventricosus TaxID=182803 RepID=A0A4Y2QPR4_ARAVE|nr:hypothetical protein AVEN_46436-1 [Araneus ventricosus]
MIENASNDVSLDDEDQTDVRATGTMLKVEGKTFRDVIRSVPRVPSMKHVVHTNGIHTNRKVKNGRIATCSMNGTLCVNYAKQANNLRVDDTTKYCVIIYESSQIYHLISQNII